jgi:hypothetical protein
LQPQKKSYVENNDESDHASENEQGEVQVREPIDYSVAAAALTRASKKGQSVQQPIPLSISKATGKTKSPTPPVSEVPVGRTRRGAAGTAAPKQ